MIRNQNHGTGGGGPKGREPIVSPSLLSSVGCLAHSEAEDGFSIPGDTTVGGVACPRTPAENVAFAWQHRDLFAEVANHNREVIKARYRGADYADPQHQYRNAWAEAGSSVPTGDAA